VNIVQAVAVAAVVVAAAEVVATMSFIVVDGTSVISYG